MHAIQEVVHVRSPQNSKFSPDWGSMQLAFVHKPAMTKIFYRMLVNFYTYCIRSALQVSRHSLFYTLDCNVLYYTLMKYLVTSDDHTQ